MSKLDRDLSATEVLTQQRQAIPGQNSILDSLLLAAVAARSMALDRFLGNPSDLSWL